MTVQGRVQIIILDNKAEADLRILAFYVYLLFL